MWADSISDGNEWWLVHEKSESEATAKDPENPYNV